MSTSSRSARRSRERSYQTSPGWVKQIRCQFKRKGRVVAVLVRRCTPATKPAVDAVIVD